METWPLATDRVHFAVEAKEDLAPRHEGGRRQVAGGIRMGLGFGHVGWVFLRWDGVASALCLMCFLFSLFAKISRRPLYALGQLSFVSNDRRLWLGWFQFCPN